MVKEEKRRKNEIQHDYSLRRRIENAGKIGKNWVKYFLGHGNIV